MRESKMLRPDSESDGKFLQSPFRLMRQPIVSTANPSQIMSHEITLQPLCGSPVLALIAQARLLSRTVEFDLQVVATLERLAHHVEALKAPIWVNLFPSTLTNPAAVNQLCQLASLFPDKLFFEVTEGEIIVDYDAARRSLDAFREAGAGIVLDDFGAGASSILTMLQIPFDAIKIDAKVFQMCALDPSHFGLIKATCESAHAQGAGVVVEGIETQPNADLALFLGIDMMQGYHIAYPQALAEPLDSLPASAWNALPTAIIAGS